MQKMGFYINISRFSINIPRFSHSRCNTVGISSAHRSRIVWVRVRRMRRQLILLWLLHFSATVLSFLTISAPSTTESVPSPSIPSHPFALLISCCLSPPRLSRRRSPKYPTSDHSTRSHTRPRPPQPFLDYPPASASACEWNIQIGDCGDGRRCRWEYVRDQGEPSHVRYSLAASEVSILPPSLPDSLPGNLQRFKMISKIRSRCMHEMV